MAIQVKDGFDYGEEQGDIRISLKAHTKQNYQATRFVDAVCNCGSHLFQLQIDEDEGVAIRLCNQCGQLHYMGDSEEYLEEAEPIPCVCLCGNEIFEITAGIALYRESDDVKWLYIGCRCVECSLIGIYGDWKNEYEDYRKLLRQI
jgi:hypothetical protein